MKTLGYRVWCREGVVEFTDPLEWHKIFDGSVLVAVQYFDRPGLRTVTAGAEHYRMSRDGLIRGVDNPDEAPSAMVREGWHAPDDVWERVYAEAMEARQWRP